MMERKLLNIKEESMRKKFFVALLVFAVSFSLSAGLAIAEDTGSPFTDAVMKMFGFTSKTTEKGVNAVGTGIKKSTDVVIEHVKDTGDLVTGDISKTDDVLIKPIKAATTAVGEAAYGVLNAPLEAGQEVSEEDIK